MDGRPGSFVCRLTDPVENFPDTARFSWFFSGVRLDSDPGDRLSYHPRRCKQESEVNVTHTEGKAMNFFFNSQFAEGAPRRMC